LFAGVAAANTRTYEAQGFQGEGIGNTEMHIDFGGGNTAQCSTGWDQKCEIDERYPDIGVGSYHDNYNNIRTCEVKASLSLTKSANRTNYSSVGDVINYTYVIKNTGNKNLEAISVSDNKVTVTCPSTPTVLVPGASITCTANYTVKGTDIPHDITNIAKASATNNSVGYHSNEDHVTVEFKEFKTLYLEKSANRTEYSSVGDVIDYTYVITNTGNVNINGPFTVSDNKVTVTCPSTPTVLVPGANITCTANYTVTGTDIPNAVINIATATADNTGTHDTCRSHPDPVISNPATATVFYWQQTGGQIPEFPTIALPIAATIGLLFVMRRKI
jgi:uncharacterized repeat protein (TIGR01451 family)